MDHLSLPVTLFLTALIAVTSSDALGAGDAMARKRGPAFDRLDVAPRSGDVKLVGDIDLDGTLDLVLGGSPADGLSWWSWPDLNRTPIARPRIEFSTDGALADIDGDGDLDIVVPDGPKGPNLMWFENPLVGGTRNAGWRRHVVGSAGGWAKDVEAVDFDQDGRIDIAVRSPTKLKVFFQDPGGRWKARAYPGRRLGQEGLASGDVDGDGDVDLVLQGAWISNPGGAASRDPAAWPIHEIGPFSSAFKALVVDVDGDGHRDIVTSSSEHRSPVVWYRAGNGPTSRWTPQVIDTAVRGAHTLQVADMDGDGDRDVVVGQMHQTKRREIAVYLNHDGQGRSWERRVIDNVGIHNGLVADIDADGDQDIYGSNWVGHPPLRLWLNQLNPRQPKNKSETR